MDLTRLGTWAALLLGALVVVLFALEGGGVPLQAAETLLWAALLAGAWGIGDLLRALAGWRPEHRAEALIVPLALGLGVEAVLLYLAGMAGLLQPGTAWLLLAAPLPVAVLRRASLRGAAAAPLSRADLGLLAVVPILLGPALLALPAPAIFFDTLVYHLGLPQQFVLEGRIPFLPYNHFSFFPLNVEMLYTWALLLHPGELLPRLLNLTCGGLLLGFTGLLGARLAGRTAGLLAAAALAGAPGLILSAAVIKDDLGAAAFQLGGLYLALRALDGARGAWVVSALLWGLALGTKYTSYLFWGAGWLTVALVAAAAWRRSPPEERRRRAFGLLVLALLPLALAAPHLLRNLALAGNPFYPAAGSLFGRSSFSHDLAGEAARTVRSAGGLLRLPWDLVFEPQRFGGFGLGRVGPIYLAFLPVLLLQAARRRLPAGSGFTGMFLLLGAGTWAWTFSNARYFYAGFAAWAVLVAAAIAGLGEDGRAKRAAATALLALCLGVGPLQVLQLEQQAYPFLALAYGSDEQREATLSRAVPYAPVARWANDNLPRDARVLMLGETRVYHLQRRAVSSSARDRTLVLEWMREAGTYAAFRARLQAEGVTHLLWNPQEAQRLNRTYGYLGFRSAAEEEGFRHLLAESPVVFEANGVSLHRVLSGREGG